MKRCFRVNSNLLYQNALIMERLEPFDKKTVYEEETYPTVDENLSGTTIEGSQTFKTVDVPYELTPETVKSYADSVNYKVDPAGAIASGVPRKNLGDVRDAQRLSAEDSSELRAMYESLKEKFEAAQKQLKKRLDSASLETSSSIPAASVDSPKSVSSEVSK